MTEFTEQQLLERLEDLEQSPFSVNFDPISLLNQALHASGKRARKRSLELIGFFPNADFIEPLFRLIADETDLELRKQAIDTLGQFLHHGSMSDYDRIEPDEWDKPEEGTGMADLSPGQFQAIRDFMGELVNQPDWSPVLRARALIYYARLNPERAATRIDQFYSSGDEALIKGAVKAIARLSEGDWRGIIMKEITRQPDDQRKQAAIDAAGQHEVEEAGPQLVRILRETTRSELRQAAVDALGRVPWSEAADHLQEYLEDEDEVVRELAEQGLRRCAHRMEREQQL